MRFALSGHWVGRSKNESRRSSTDPSIWLLLANPASSGSRQTAWGDSGRCSGAPYRKLNSFYFVPRKRKEKEVEDEGHAKPKASCGQKVLPQTRTPSSSFWVGGAEYWVNHRRDRRNWRSRTTSPNQFNTKARHKEEGASKESSDLQKSIHVRTSFISAFTKGKLISATSIYWVLQLFPHEQANERPMTFYAIWKLKLEPFRFYTGRYAISFNFCK